MCYKFYMWLCIISQEITVRQHGNNNGIERQQFDKLVIENSFSMIKLYVMLSLRGIDDVFSMISAYGCMENTKLVFSKLIIRKWLVIEFLEKKKIFDLNCDFVPRSKMASANETPRTHFSIHLCVSRLAKWWTTNQAKGFCPCDQSCMIDDGDCTTVLMSMRNSVDTLIYSKTI